MQGWGWKKTPIMRAIRHCVNHLGGDRQPLRYPPGVATAARPAFCHTAGCPLAGGHCQTTPFVPRRRQQGNQHPMKSPSMFRGLLSFSTMTMVSRVLALLRDISMSHVFGASAATDAFVIAFRIPNFMRRLFAEGSFSTAFQGPLVACCWWWWRWA